MTNKKYDPKNIQFDCLKESIDQFEARNGRTSDYGFIYMQYIARACEIASTDEVKAKIDASVTYALGRN